LPSSTSIWKGFRVFPFLYSSLTCFPYLLMFYLCLFAAKSLLYLFTVFDSKCCCYPLLSWTRLNISYTCAFISAASYVLFKSCIYFVIIKSICMTTSFLIRFPLFDDDKYKHTMTLVYLLHKHSSPF